MNVEQLSQFLHKNTTSESHYLKGIEQKSFDNLPYKMIHGHKVYHLSYIDSKHATNFRQLYIKKHSRFSDCPMHNHNWVEINYVFSGQCIQTINDTTYTLKKGELILIDSDTPHSIKRAEENDIIMSIIISPDFLHANFFNRFSKDSILSSFFMNALNEDTNHNNFIIFNSSSSRRLPIFANELFCEFYDPTINSEDIQNNLFALIVDELINVYEQSHYFHHQNRLSRRIIEVLHYIEINHTTCTLQSTADHFDISPSYLSSYIKRKTGSSFKELLIRQRLVKATQLLAKSQLPISVIAHEVGYENVSFFYRLFKHEYDCTPSQYRKNQS